MFCSGLQFVLQRNELSEASRSGKLPALFCSLLTGRETDPALPPQTPFSPSFFLQPQLLLLLLFLEDPSVSDPGGNLPPAPSSRTGGWEDNQKADNTRLESYLGLNYDFPFGTRERGGRCVSWPVRAARRGCPPDGWRWNPRAPGGNGFFFFLSQGMLISFYKKTP